MAGAVMAGNVIGHDFFALFESRRLRTHRWPLGLSASVTQFFTQLVRQIVSEVSEYATLFL